MSKTISLFTLSIFITFISQAYSHSGGTNSDGCHKNHKTGGYHCHNSGSYRQPNASTSSQNNYNYIKQDGTIYKDFKDNGKYPLSSRRWYTTSEGGASHIFINISANTLKNGYCNKGAIASSYTAGTPPSASARVMFLKCFDYNNTKEMKRMVFIETKKLHFLEVGRCSGGSFLQTLFKNNCSNSYLRTPSLWNTLRSVGDGITQDECETLINIFNKHNWDNMC